MLHSVRSVVCQFSHSSVVCLVFVVCLGLSVSVSLNSGCLLSCVYVSVRVCLGV